ncbi:MAG: hypothetical protein IJW70_05035 [Clostridia bacterium]|nr:hypothetical protein [Clostridia bacterium]
MNIHDKLIFTDRMAHVHADILPRLRHRDAREGTFIDPVPPVGNPFADVFEEMPDAPYVIALAHAIVRSWLDTPCVIYPHEAVVGITRPTYPILEHFSWGIQFHDHIYDHYNYPAGERERTDKLRDRMTPLDYRHLLAEGDRVLGKEAYQTLGHEWMFNAGGYQGHTIPNYVTLLSRGLDGMLAYIDECAQKNAQDQTTQDFYEANRIIVRGMIAFLEKYAAYAAALAETETNAVQKRYYGEIAQNCAKVAHNAPNTLYEAVQLAWVLSLWDWVDCLGRVDQFFYPFYQYSLEHGDVISVEESITSFMFKIWECGAHNATVGGCLPEDGTDATNSLSYLFLQVLRNIHDTHPRMVVRIAKDTPKDLIDLAVLLWSEGMCDPTVVSDETVIPGLVKLGVTLQDARNYATLGCQEIEVPGMSNTGCEDGSFNLAKVFEIAMLGGRATKRPDFQLGPVTKPLTECESFEEFFEGFAEQLRFFTKIHCILCRKGQEIRGANHAKLVKGVFTTGCLERGLPHDAGGPIYGYGVMETAGLAAVADAMTAIKLLIFEQKRITAEQLTEAMNTNFEGYERTRQMLLHVAPKFGNDDDTADEMAARVLRLYWEEIAKYESGRGGIYTGACSLLGAGISYGQTLGAFPDGRFACEPLGNTMGPRPGADTNGLSAMLNSVAKLPMELGVGGTTLNVILSQKMLSTPELRASIGATMTDFMLHGGCMAQITSANLEDLLDAKVHPERHGNLTVRVGGYSAKFVQLDQAMQDEIISRYTAE